ncbi:MAG: SDR family oxidoreductase, partial [Lentisphaeria bacterium]|nr:SDR family oxidoreductase [Lentisphaeria bacterium]
MSTLASFRLDSRVSVVTGGARGLGYDIADALAEAGSDLVITSRQQETVDEAADKFRQAHGVQVLPLTLDHCDFDQVVAVAQQAADWQGRIDVLVNNAGGGVGGIPDLFERPPEAIKTMIETNLIGPMYCCREFGRTMVGAGRGSIINIASISGHIPLSGVGTYSAAKAAVLSLTRFLARLWAEQGVRVNAITPGFFP